MDLTLTAEQELIRDAAREFLAARCPTSQVRALRDDAVGHSEELWKEMVELGWPALALPEAHGGVGSSFLDLCLVVEELGRVPLPGPFVATTVLGGLPIARFGTDEQQATHLSAIAAGEQLMSCALSGPDGRWPPAEPGVVATERDGGFVLDGTALFVPYAHVADALLVAARRDGAAGGELTVLIVDADAEGVRVEPLETVGDDREHRLELTEVAVDGDRVLGEVDAGREVVETIAEHGAAATCAEMVGGAQRVLDMTVEYAGQREQFGRPIGSFQAVQHACADMATDVLTARFLAYEAIWRLAEGLEATTEVSVAKGWVSEAYQRVCASGHQIHGAIGFTEEHDLHLFLRHATAAALRFGDADHHWDALASRLGL